MVQNFDFDDNMKYVYTIQTKSKDEPNIAVVIKYDRETGKCLSHAELEDIGHAESLEVIKTYSNGDVQMITTSS
ncbi:MAG: hypothetical protein MR274_09560 [Clostridium sp.]|nr:hypothetical protein [Clostridium sp.]MDY3829050.1 hypothetical protein [Clostridium sp.]